MEKEIGLFPLNLVAFPGEQLNLHIFEPRYKQLINDCLELKTTFGIPAFINNKIEYGTEMRVKEVTRLYEDGRMDIKTEGLNVFKVIDFQNPWKNRLYGGGLVQTIEQDSREDKELKLRLVDLTQQLFDWLKMEEFIQIDFKTSLHQIVHKVGLKVDEEYELLKISSESDRQMYIVQHIKRILPILERAEKAKEIIRMNGHFKHLDPLKF